MFHAGHSVKKCNIRVSSMTSGGGSPPRQLLFQRANAAFPR
jgi:hypothetical protein